MKLYGSHTSPFVRKLRMFFNFHHVPYEFVAINYLDAKDSEFLKKHNPINKIPFIALDTGEVVFDSRVIFNHISKEFKIAPLSLAEENILSEIDSLLETGVNLFSLRRGGLDFASSDHPYLKRQQERLDLILNSLSPWVQNISMQDWNFLSMSLYCALYWSNFREIIKVDHYPVMKEFLERFSSKKEVLETPVITN